MSAVEDDNRTRLVSPELVLVDPELAAWCRLRLCEEAAAEEARRAEPPRISPSATVLEFLPSAQPQRTDAESAPGSRLLRLEGVVVTAAVLLLAISGAAARPDRARFAPKRTAAPPIVITWPNVRNAQWYDVEVLRGTQTIFRVERLRATQLAFPRSWRYDGRNEVVVRAVLGLRGNHERVIVRGPLGPWWMSKKGFPAKTGNDCQETVRACSITRMVR